MKCTFVVEHDVGSVRLPSPFLDVVVDSKLNCRNYRFDLDRNCGKFILGLSTPSSTPHQLASRLGRQAVTWDRIQRIFKQIAEPLWTTSGHKPSRLDCCRGCCPDGRSTSQHCFVAPVAREWSHQTLPKLLRRGPGPRQANKGN